MDGVEHVYHFTKSLVVHGGTGRGIAALEGLREGNTVVVHYTVNGTENAAREIDRVGDEGLKVTEGVVTLIDRKRKQITIRFDYGNRDISTHRSRGSGSRKERRSGGARRGQRHRVLLGCHRP